MSSADQASTTDPLVEPPKREATTNSVPGAEEEEEEEENKSTRERRKIEIRFIQDKSRRHITFSKRKAGIMKKAYELSVLTGTQVLLLVVSETGLVYTFSTPKLQPLITKPEGKNLIQACLNAPEEPEESHEEEYNDRDNSHQQSPQPAHNNGPVPQQQQGPPVQGGPQYGQPQQGPGGPGGYINPEHNGYPPYFGMPPQQQGYPYPQPQQ